MLDCDFIVTIEDKGWLKKKFLKYIDTPIVETKGLYIIGYGGTAGVSFALQSLKADKVYIAGMDLYRTDYYYSEGTPKGVRRPYDERVILWKHYKKHLGIDANRVIPLSGPLVDI